VSLRALYPTAQMGFLSVWNTAACRSQIVRRGPRRAVDRSCGGARVSGLSLELCARRGGERLRGALVLNSIKHFWAVHSGGFRRMDL
jgi:hypothetical protein